MNCNLHWPCWLGLIGTVVHEHLAAPILGTTALKEKQVCLSLNVGNKFSGLWHFYFKQKGHNCPFPNPLHPQVFRELLVATDRSFAEGSVSDCIPFPSSKHTEDATHLYGNKCKGLHAGEL